MRVEHVPSDEPAREPRAAERNDRGGQSSAPGHDDASRGAGVDLSHRTPDSRRTVLWLQRSAGNRAVQRMLARGGDATVQRQDDEGAPELVAQLEDEIAEVDADAGQDDDLYLRAYANRASLLLRFRTHAPFETQEQLDDFIGEAHQLATTEMDTLNAFGASGAELALATTPKGFPLTWSGRVHAALTLGGDPAAVLAESLQRHTALATEAAALPPRIVDKGLPIALADVAALREFRLTVPHVRLPAGNAVGDFARSTVRYAQFRFFAAFLVSWERMVDDVAGAVADGTYVPRDLDYRDFVQNKQQILRDLPARARDRMAMTDEELRALEQDAVGLADAALAAGALSALVGIFSVLGGWDEGSGMFADSLQAADGLVAGAGDGDRVLMALRWMWDASWLSAALGEAFWALVAAGPDILKSLAVIVVAQMIPFVNVGVDVYLMFQLGVDVISQLGELGAALADVMGATTVLGLERAAGRLARVLASGGIQILVTLVTMGVARGVSALRARAARIRAANPALSEAEAMERAMREAPASERAPLEATRGLSTWERRLSDDTRPILDTPGVRPRLAALSDETRRLLTLCASPCLPPAHQLLAADLSRLDAIVQRLGVPGDHPGLREYFYRRRANLQGAIDALDQGAPTPADLRAFLDRSIASAARLPPGASVTQGPDGRWVWSRGPGGRAGRAAQVTEYDIRPYREHGTDHGTHGFFQSHHGVQGEWARETGVPGYAYGDAHAILLRDSAAGSPHRIVTDRQAGRAAGRASRTYAEERRLMREDLQAAGVPETYIAASERANDVYFGALYRGSGLTPAELVRWFGSWVP